MHIQIKAKTAPTGFPNDDDEETVITASAQYQPGTLRQLLGVLADAGFNLRSAGGQRIELGGDFTFWVGKRSQDDDHESAAFAARDTLIGSGYDAHAVEVSVALLDDEPGALHAFLEDIARDDLLIEDINVGTPNQDGKIPVQIFTVRQGPAQS